MSKKRRIELKDSYDFDSSSEWDFTKEVVRNEINLNDGEMELDMEQETSDQSDSDSENDMEQDNQNESASDSESESDIEALVESFNFKLRKWSVKHHITLMALTALLKLLREQGLLSLPKDARTLLKTPKTVNVTNIGEGKYWYRSLKDLLVKYCKKIKCPSLLELCIHVDGFVPFVSSKLEFWPIQCWIKGIKMRPFFVGLHFGKSKPTDLELFLRPLLNDLHDLLANGLQVKIKKVVTKFAVEINQMIFDAPARAYLKCIVGHSGYFSCERCEEEGEYLVQPEDVATGETSKTKKEKKKKPKGHVCLIGTDAPLRTDESFRNQKQEEHHHGRSPLEELPIDMIRTIPLEYEHLICQGIQKKLLLFWVNGTKNYKTKFSATDIKQISDKLVQARETKPSEINRPSRPLNCLSFWKATEFRTFLLKIGPVVLRDHLTKEAYNHFLALFCATTICSSKQLLKYKPVAKKLFHDFVLKYGDIYGDENYCYTGHSLIHVTDDVDHFGVLDEYSAFRGESNLAFLKSLIHGGYKPLQQIAKRLQELESVELLEAQVPKKETELKKNILRYKDLRLDSSDKNRWILTTQHNIFKIESFTGSDEGNIKIHGTILDKTKQKNLFDVPIQSSKLSIYTSTLVEKETLSLNLDEIHCKLFKLHVAGEDYAFFPLYHFTQ